MDSYIVRIYRRHAVNPNGAIGLVEKVGNNEKRLFHNLNELSEILSEPKAGQSHSVAGVHLLKTPVTTGSTGSKGKRIRSR